MIVEKLLLPLKLNKHFMLAVALVLIQACATNGQGNYNQSRLKNLNNFDSKAQYTIFDVSNDSVVYTFEDQYYTRGTSGLQKRPFVKNVLTGKTKRGFEADKIFNNLRKFSPSQTGGEKLNGICKGESFNCLYDVDSMRMYVFSDRGKPLEIITHSKALFEDAMSARTVLGNSIFERLYYEFLFAAVDVGDEDEEHRLIEDLGEDLDLKKLYEYKKLERHKDLYVAQLRSEDSFDSYRKAYSVSKEIIDIDKMFSLRTGKLDQFVVLIDELDGQSNEVDTKRGKALARYNAAPDIIYFREKTLPEIEERARLAEKKRLENEKINRAEAKRQKIVKAQRAKLTEDRERIRREYRKYLSRGKTPCRLLVEASYNRNLPAVREIVEYYNVNVNCIDKKAGSALWSSLIRRGSSDSGLDVVKYLVDQGANVKYRREGDSVSYFAGYKGKSESAVYIVANGGSRSDAERGLKQANLNAAVFLKGLELGATGVGKTIEFVKESIRSGAEADSKGLLRGYYTCSTKCTGQGGVFRGDPGTIKIFAPNGYTARQETKGQFDAACKVFHFYAGGGGSASAAFIDCDLE